MEEKKNIYYLCDILKKDNNQKFFNFIRKQKDCEFFVGVSIFDKKEYEKYNNEFTDKIKNNNLSELEKSCIGSIVGMAIGDAMGAGVEFKPLSYTFDKINNMSDSSGGKFKLKPGQWTDDTSMGLCLADSLIENRGIFNPRDIMLRFILWWHYGYNNTFRLDKDRKNKHSVGLGGNISGSLKYFIENKGENEYTNYGNKKTSGNGSIMRNAAIPICYFRNEKEALKFAKKQSLITHQGEEAAGCCQLLTFIIVQIFKQKNKNFIMNENSIKESKINDNNDLTNNMNKESIKTILNNLENFKCEYNSVNCLANSQQEGNDKNRNWNWKDENFKYSESRAKEQPGYIGSYCMDALAMALHALYTTESFEKAILKVVNLCGDSDSVGAVVGQIAGAYYGLDSIPKDWIYSINKWDNMEIALRGYLLLHLNEIFNNSINIENNEIEEIEKVKNKKDRRQSRDNYDYFIKIDEKIKTIRKKRVCPCSIY